MKEISKIVVNKNRGWRGLAEVAVMSKDKDLITKNIFSFSQAVWNDLICKHIIVVAYEEYYCVIHFTDVMNNLPRENQQRSVLIKNVSLPVEKVTMVRKTEWSSLTGDEWNAMYRYLHNKNNHTTSDWNCIGIRVMPEI